MYRLFYEKTQQRQLCQTVFVVFVILQVFVRIYHIKIASTTQKEKPIRPHHTCPSLS
ncbi:hypothetical protein bcgnr5386_53230 [Bacillus cereus]